MEKEKDRNLSGKKTGAGVWKTALVAVFVGAIVIYGAFFYEKPVIKLNQEQAEKLRLKLNPENVR